MQCVSLMPANTKRNRLRLKANRDARRAALTKQSASDRIAEFLTERVRQRRLKSAADAAVMDRIKRKRAAWMLKRFVRQRLADIKRNRGELDDTGVVGMASPEEEQEMPDLGRRRLNDVLHGEFEPGDVTFRHGVGYIDKDGMVLPDDFGPDDFVIDVSGGDIGPEQPWRDDVIIPPFLFDEETRSSGRKRGRELFGGDEGEPIVSSYGTVGTILGAPMSNTGTVAGGVSGNFVVPRQQRRYNDTAVGWYLRNEANKSYNQLRYSEAKQRERKNELNLRFQRELDEDRRRVKSKEELEKIKERKLEADLKSKLTKDFAKKNLPWSQFPYFYKNAKRLIEEEKRKVQQAKLSSDFKESQRKLKAREHYFAEVVKGTPDNFGIWDARNTIKRERYMKWWTDRFQLYNFNEMSYPSLAEGSEKARNVREYMARFGKEYEPNIVNFPFDSTDFSHEHGQAQNAKRGIIADVPDLFATAIADFGFHSSSDCRPGKQCSMCKERSR